MDPPILADVGVQALVITALRAGVRATQAPLARLTECGLPVTTN
jgi:hypothetical protein